MDVTHVPCVRRFNFLHFIAGTGTIFPSCLELGQWREWRRTSLALTILLHFSNMRPSMEKTGIHGNRCLFAPLNQRRLLVRRSWSPSKKLLTFNGRERIECTTLIGRESCKDSFKSTRNRWLCMIDTSSCGIKKGSIPRFQAHKSYISVK